MIIKGGGEDPRPTGGGVRGRGSRTPRPTPAALARGVEALGHAAELAARLLGADRETCALIGRGMREFLAAEVAAELADRERQARGGAPDPQ